MIQMKLLKMPRRRRKTSNTSQLFLKVSLKDQIQGKMMSRSLKKLSNSPGLTTSQKRETKSLKT